jgi:hypothetical protein
MGQTPVVVLHSLAKRRTTNVRDENRAGTHAETESIVTALIINSRVDRHNLSRLTGSARFVTRPLHVGRSESPGAAPAAG